MLNEDEELPTVRGTRKLKTPDTIIEATENIISNKNDKQFSIRESGVLDSKLKNRDRRRLKKNLRQVDAQIEKSEEAERQQISADEQQHEKQKSRARFLNKQRESESSNEDSEGSNKSRDRRRRSQWTDSKYDLERIDEANRLELQELQDKTKLSKIKFKIQGKIWRGNNLSLKEQELVESTPELATLQSQVLESMNSEKEISRRQSERDISRNLKKKSQRNSQTDSFPFKSGRMVHSKPASEENYNEYSSEDSKSFEYSTEDQNASEFMDNNRSIQVWGESSSPAFEKEAEDNNRRLLQSHRRRAILADPHLLTNEQLDNYHKADEEDFRQWKEDREKKSERHFERKRKAAISSFQFQLDGNRPDLGRFTLDENSDFKDIRYEDGEIHYLGKPKSKVYDRNVRLNKSHVPSKKRPKGYNDPYPDSSHTDDSSSTDSQGGSSPRPPKYHHDQDDFDDCGTKRPKTSDRVSALNTWSFSAANQAGQKTDQNTHSSSTAYGGKQLEMGNDGRTIYLNSTKELFLSKILQPKEGNKPAVFAEEEQMAMYNDLGKAKLAGLPLYMRRYLDPKLVDPITKALKARTDKKTGLPFLHAKGTPEDWLDLCNRVENIPVFQDFWKVVFDIHVSKLAKYNDTEFEVLDLIKKKFKPFLDPIRSAVTNHSLLEPFGKLIVDFQLDVKGVWNAEALHKVMKAFLRTLDVSKDEKGKGISRENCKLPLDKIRAVCWEEYKSGAYDKCDDFVVSVNNQITKVQEENKKLRELNTYVTFTPSDYKLTYPTDRSKNSDAPFIKTDNAKKVYSKNEAKDDIEEDTPVEKINFMKNKGKKEKKNISVIRPGQVAGSCNKCGSQYQHQSGTCIFDTLKHAGVNNSTKEWLKSSAYQNAQQVLNKRQEKYSCLDFYRVWDPSTKSVVNTDFDSVARESYLDDRFGRPKTGTAKGDYNKKGSKGSKGNGKSGFKAVKAQKANKKGKENHSILTLLSSTSTCTSTPTREHIDTIPLMCSTCECLNTLSGREYTAELYKLTEIANNLTLGDIPDTITTQILNDDLTINFDTLLDTGALQGNYVSSKCVLELIKSGLVEVGSCNVNICGAFDGCQHSDTFIVCDVLFNNNIINSKFLNKNKFFKLKLKLTVLEHLPFEMIIGRRDILKYDLMKATEIVHRVVTNIPTVPSKHIMSLNGFKGFKKKKKKSLFTIYHSSTNSKSLIKEVANSKCIATSVVPPTSEKLSSTPIRVAGSKTSTNQPFNNSTNAAKIHQNLMTIANAKASSNLKTAVQVNDASALHCDGVKSASNGSARPVDSRSALLKPVDLGVASYIPWDDSPLTYNEQMFQYDTFSAYGQEPATRPLYTIFVHRNDQASIKWKSKTATMARSGEEAALWSVTTSEQLHTLLKNQNSAVNSASEMHVLKSTTAYDTNLQDTVNRTHISDFFHYEEDAQGIETTGSDLPAYQWDWDAKQPKLVGHKVNNRKNNNHSTSEGSKTSSATSYIPTQIYGSPQLVKDIKRVCEKYLRVFNTCLGPEPAHLEPMTLNVDLSKWHSNTNKGPPRGTTASKVEEIQKQIGKMLPNQVIQTSQAEYYSQVHLTPKPVHTLEKEVQQLDTSSTVPKEVDATIPLAVQIAIGWRFCVDFRNLNLACTGLGWPLPNIPEMLRRLGDHKPKIFGKLDLTSGYHQAPLSLSSRVYTAFICFMGVYEWCRVPMGLKGAGSYFQGVLSSQVLSGLMYNTCELYIDDLIVHAQTHEQFIERLDQLLSRLAEHRLRVNPDKCSFGMDEVEYVGHTINEHGLTFSRNKIDKVLQIDTPVLGKDLKSFLGVAVYFIDHIQNYASIVAPLHAMLHDYDRNRRLIWTEPGRVAFHQIKESINNCTTLFFIDDHSPITLTTDASDFGIGGYLSQLVDGVERPVAFVSHGLSQQEIRWSTIEKECYAIVYTLKKLNYLLGDRQFTLKTDHKNLTYLDADANEKVKRWKIAVQQYDMILEYIKGPLNIIADGMSRLVASNKCPVSHGISLLREVPLQIYINLMREIDCAHSAHEMDRGPLVVDTESINAILREFQVPHKERAIIEKVHNSLAGHAGVERTFDRLVQQGHHWEYMREHVKYFIKHCPYCQKMCMVKTPIHTTPFTTAAYAPMQRQNWDSIGPLTLTTGETCHILVAIDCHTRWTELWLIPDVEMATVRLPMLQHFGRYGNPAQILTDNGTQFMNGTVKELLQMINLQHITVLAYSKEENSIVERMNKEVMRHLRALVYEHSENENIEELLPSVQRIINANRNESNQTSPADLLFGNSINLDRGIFLQQAVLTDMNISLSSWASSMLKAQASIMRKAELIQRTKDAEHIARADPRRSEFAIGSYVLLEYHSSILRKGPPNKFNTQLRGPFKVLRKLGSMYTLRDSNTNKDIDTHITLLHPFHFQPQFVDPVDIARRDVLSAFTVESISAHSGDTRTNSEFLVKWAGYDNTHDLWIPYKELRDVVVLHEYLFENNLKNLIPTQHRIGRFVLVTRAKKPAKPVKAKAKKAAKVAKVGRTHSLRPRTKG